MGSWSDVGRTIGLRPDGREVVTVERDVEDAERHLDALQPPDLVGERLGERHAAGADADQDQPRCPLVLLQDLPRHAPHDAIHLARVEKLARALRVGLGQGGLRESAGWYGKDPGAASATRPVP